MGLFTSCCCKNQDTLSLNSKLDAHKSSQNCKVALGSEFGPFLDFSKSQKLLSIEKLTNEFKLLVVLMSFTVLSIPLNFIAQCFNMFFIISCSPTQLIFHSEKIDSHSIH